MIFDNSGNVEHIEKFLNDKYNGSTIFVNGKFGQGKTTAVNKALKNKNYQEEEILRLDSYTPLTRINYFQYLSNTLFFDKIKNFALQVIFFVWLGYFISYLDEHGIPQTIANFLSPITKLWNFPNDIISLFSLSYWIFVFFWIFWNRKYLTLLVCKILNVSGDNAIHYYITPEIKKYKVIILDDFDRFISKYFFYECVALLQFIKEHADGIVIVIGDSTIINKICNDETGEYFEKYYDYRVAFVNQYDVIFSLLKKHNLTSCIDLFRKYGITNLREVQRFTLDYDMIEENIYKCLVEGGYENIFNKTTEQPGPHLNADQIFLLWVKSNDLYPNPDNLDNEELDAKFEDDVSEKWRIDKINIGPSYLDDIAVFNMTDLKNKDVQDMNIMNNEEETGFLLNLFKFICFNDSEIIHHVDGLNPIPYFLCDSYFSRYKIMNNEQYYIIRIVLTVLWYASLSRYEYIRFWQFLFETDGYIGSSEINIDAYIKIIRGELIKFTNDYSVIRKRVLSYLRKLNLNIKKQLFNYSIYTLNIDLYETLYRSLDKELTPNDLDILKDDKMVGFLVCDAIDLNNDKKQFLSEIEKRDL